MRQMLRIMGLCLVLSFGLCSFGQNDSGRVQKLVGFDANTLLGQVVPFSSFQQGDAFPAVMVRRLWNGRGYRTGVGFDFDSENEVLKNIYFSFGYARLRGLSEKFGYTSGLEFKLAISEDFDNGFIGLSKYWGVEYRLNKVISVSTEAAMQLGLLPDVGAFNFAITPPIRIQCHFRLK